MELLLKAKHFKYTHFAGNCNCAIAKAAKDQFNSKDVEEFIYSILVDDVEYRHAAYLVQHFRLDHAEAKISGYGDTVIRTIKLKKAKP